MKIKVDFFSGFLGAGKTKLIKKLINEKFNAEKIIVIENEFGKIGIDGSFMKKYDIKVKEINAGCICCSILSDFKNALQEIITIKGLERIIIEPSGVGKLSEIVKVVKALESTERIFINMIITVVDVTMYEDFIDIFGEFYKDQIAYANTIVLSRTQNVDYGELQSVATKIRRINKKAKIITTPWDKLSGNNIAQTAEQYVSQDLFENLNIIRALPEKSKFTTRKKNSADEVFNSWGIETPKVFFIERIEYILNNLSNEELYGKILRAKGIVQIDENGWIEFDYVPKGFEIRATTADYTGRICVIGTNLNKDQLRLDFIN